MERYFICDIDNKKEWQHFKLKRCHFFIGLLPCLI